MQGTSHLREVNVADRPVTNHGMMGMKQKPPSTAGGRQVQDYNYFVAQLRRRITDITGELKTIREQSESLAKENSQAGVLERRYETLENEVRGLEGQLADYNLARDKARSSTDPDELRSMVYQLKERNKQDEKDVDRIYIMRQQKERSLRELDQEAEQLRMESETRVKSLEPSKLQLYQKLSIQARNLQEDSRSKDRELQGIRSKLNALENEGGGAGMFLRQQYSEHEMRLSRLDRERQSLSEELDIARSDPKDAHTRFVARMKGDTAKTNELDQHARSLVAEIERLRKQDEDLSSTNITKESVQQERDTVEKLMQRDKDMDAFIDNFDAQREQAIGNLQESQSLIVMLLEDMSKNLEEKDNLPDVGTVQEMKENKSFKEKNLETAVKTQQQLERERRKVEEQLKNITDLEPRMMKEKQNVLDRTQRLQSELPALEDIDALRRAFDATQQQLQTLKRSYLKRRDTLRGQVSTLSSENEGMKKEIAGNEVHKQMDDLEKKIRHKEQSLFALKEYVETKQRETDYMSVRDNCMRQIDTINTIVIQQGEAAEKAYAAGY